MIKICIEKIKSAKYKYIKNIIHDGSQKNSVKNYSWPGTLILRYFNICFVSGI